ncbi:hypothetical protein ARNL5_00366 [Anaerolineae bacterium]|nr:hypothetical protein ARNL5_00366 [Anaerolineae bacterium]
MSRRLFQRSSAPEQEVPPPGRYEIRFPEKSRLSQDREYCEVMHEGQWKRIRFHDYDSIYQLPGLYEQIFYEALQCRSHDRLSQMLGDALVEHGERINDLRMLELGAGNGVVGEKMRALGVQALAGLDISPVAREAALRDRPGVYDDYHVLDLTRLEEAQAGKLRAYRPNCLLAVASLGFGDIPPQALTAAINLVAPRGWVAMNVKHEFVASARPDSYGALLRGMAASGILEIRSYHIYTHRLSVDGRRLHYAALVARKVGSEAKDANVAEIALAAKVA